MTAANPRGKTLSSVLQNVTSKQKVAAAEAVRASNAILREAEPHLTELAQPDAYREHLTTYLVDALDALADGSREEVCSCPRPTCPLKQAEIPPSADEYDDLAEGTRAYRRNHVGNAVVLKDARTDYMQTVAEVREYATQAVVALDAEDPWTVAEAAGVDADDSDLEVTP